MLCCTIHCQVSLEPGTQWATREKGGDGKAAVIGAASKDGRSADLGKAHVLHTIAFDGVCCCRLIKSLFKRSSVRQNSLLVGICRTHQLLQKKHIP